MNNVPPPDRKKAGKTGYDKAGYSKQVMVNAANVEKSMLEVLLQFVRDNPDVRRPDGRKSPYMLCAEEALRLRKRETSLEGALRAKHQEIETLRAEYDRIFDLFKEFRDGTVKHGFQQRQSRWFRLGRWLGFYR